MPSPRPSHRPALPAAPPAVRRRTVLTGGVAGGAVSSLALTATASGAPTAVAPALPARVNSRFFAHGVASGDPGPTQVVLWTRVTPTAESLPGSGVGPQARLGWEVATDAAMRDVVRRGRFVTGPARDHTAKLTVSGLRPDTWYFYRFTFDGHRSRVGRTRTTPAAGASAAAVGHVRLGFLSCSNMQAGWFSAYRHLAARRDLHAVVHLGDYFYESGPDGSGMGADDVIVRPHVPDHEILTLADYRQRHAQYKGERDLQDLHAAYPWIATWDDHESANDAWKDGAGNHTESPKIAMPEGGEGRWLERRARSHRAYDEWMPVRMNGSVALGDGARLFRKVGYGRLMDLAMLDLRTYRDQQIESMTDAAAIDDSERSITGTQQLAWLKDTLATSTAQWKVVGNPVMIAPFSAGGVPAPAADALNEVLGGVVAANGTPLNTDAWDGYTDERRELFAHIAEQEIQDVVFITGDIHTGLAADLPLDKATYPVSGTAGVEMVCASVTSNNFKDATDSPPGTSSEAIAGALRASNPHYQYANLDDHGYCVLDVTPERVQCDWWVIATRAERDAGISHDASYAVLAGTGRLTAVADPV